MSGYLEFQHNAIFFNKLVSIILHVFDLALRWIFRSAPHTAQGVEVCDFLVSALSFSGCNCLESVARAICIRVLQKKAIFIRFGQQSKLVMCTRGM
jgi:hypothetical protein